MAEYNNIVLNEDNIGKLCRACLGSGAGKMEPIFSSGGELGNLLSICSGIEVSKEDGFPTLLCQECVSSLHRAHSFREGCQIAHKFFKQWMDSLNAESNYIVSMTPDDSEDQLLLLCSSKDGALDDSIGTDGINTSQKHLLSISSDDDLPLIYIPKLQKPQVPQTSPKVSCRRKIKKNCSSGSTLSKDNKKPNQRFPIKVKDSIKDVTDSFACGMCTATSTTKEAVKVHRQMHFYFRCKKCKNKCEGVDGWREHECTGNLNENVTGISELKIKIKHVQRSATEADQNSFEKIFWCHLCERDLTCSRSLKYHLRSHTGEKPHLCTVCGNRFREQRALINHTRAVHTGDKRFKCSFCPKAFPVSGKKHQHERTHTGEKPYQCRVCCRLFAARSTLNAHERRHTQESKFHCKVEGCGQGFYSFSTYQRHMWAHRGERPYQCTRCNKTYLSKQNLKAHQKSVHFHVRDEVCHICNKEFTEKSTLNRHIRTIHKVEPKSNKKPVPVYGFPVDESENKTGE